MLNILFSLCVYFLCSIKLVENVRGELFTSLEEMTRLVHTQAEITNRLKQYLDVQYEKLNKGKEILKDFESTAEITKTNPNTFIGNPINSFLIVKNLAKDLQKFVDTVNSYDTLTALVRDIKESHLLPDDEDYRGTIAAIHRLEDTYLLEPEKIRSGKLSEKYSSRPLTAYECFEFGRVAYEADDFYHAIRWMNQSLIQVELEGEARTANRFDIIDYLAHSSAKQGNLYHAFELTKILLEMDPKNERIQTNYNFYSNNLKGATKRLLGDDGNQDQQKSIDNPYEFKNPRPEHVLGVERDNYEALCRGEELKIPIALLSRLKCRYVNHNPLLIIAPVKEEKVYEKPDIWLYHDVITEKQINMMKNLGYPKLKRAIVRSPITGRYETADYRISKSGWLSDNEDPRLPYLTRLVSSITNLSMTTAEDWQIANYGVGGQYEPHFDFARKREPGNAFDDTIGNRIATWLFYLEVPEIGGSTVFPRIGAKVQPMRRSAAFWFNLLPSGEGDYLTRHAACPVLFGTKWVSNKWIHMIGQEFIRPCNLAPEFSEDP